MDLEESILFSFEGEDYHHKGLPMYNSYGCDICFRHRLGIEFESDNNNLDKFICLECIQEFD